MPTPFTHLEIAQRLLRDEIIAPEIRALLEAERGAFLLGNIAADARVNSGVEREITHFYNYRVGIPEPPWCVMVKRYPQLLAPIDSAHRAFMAGYVAHLSVDEIWSLRLVGPHFGRGEWGDGLKHRFCILQMLLIHLDERDFRRIESWQADQLGSVAPRQWLPFLPDDDLRDWQHFIGKQTRPGGKSRTLKVLGERIGMRPKECRAFIDSPQQMQTGLWDYVPPLVVAEVETSMYNHAREQMIAYLDETTIP